MMIALAAAAALQAANPNASLSGSGYHSDARMAPPSTSRLVWRDEFNGTALDKAKWRFDTSRNKQGWFNGERQYYAADRPANVRVADGKLVFTARHEKLDPARYPDWGGQDYTSGKIVSAGTGKWKYGFFEVRAQLPCARGTWPAIWMLPVKLEKWPDEGEIDIMEQVGSEPNLIYATLHTALFNHTRKTQRGAQKVLPTSCTAFHRYQLDWRPDMITIGIDGRAFMRVRNNQPGGRGAWPFDEPFDLILNLAVGGAWAAAKGIDNAAMPQRMEVDYVRVWQRR
jgi:beta-glucanase (GH16 family)